MSLGLDKTIDDSEISVNTNIESNNGLYNCGCELCQGILSTVSGKLTSNLTEQLPNSNETNGQPYYVDALLFSGEPRWNSPNNVGTRVTVTYSFMTGIPNYMNPNNGAFTLGSGNDETTVNNFVGFSDFQQNTVRQLLNNPTGQVQNLFSEVANITFQEVADANGGGQIRFGTGRRADADGDLVAGAWAWRPGDGNGGDVWLNNGFTDNLNPVEGSFAFATLIHEIGHAIGLKHPGNYNAGGGGADGPFLPASEDNLQHTVMSYNNHPNQNMQPSSLLLYDIATVQYLYGENMTTRTGNNTYFWIPGENFVEVIWDAGGDDTIDASNQFNRAIINLNAGKFSSVGSNNGSDARDNLAIAFKVTIENATGGSSDDELIGNDVDNRLDGGEGIDRMSGGRGNDSYRVNSQSDTVTESFDAGLDSVEAEASFELSENVENLRLIGERAFNGTGNASANQIEGNENANLLQGKANSDILISGAGDDRLDGGSEIDEMFGGAGNDTYVVDHENDRTFEFTDSDIDSVEASVDYTLESFVENLILTGNTVFGTGNKSHNVILGNQNRNVLNGLVGDDTLDGGVGDDSMAGGTGNDTYFVDSEQDSVTEASNAGSDMVNSTIDYTLSPNLENLTLQGQAIRGIGNAVGNAIVGNGENNILHGNLGDDALSGNAGNDRLNGGAGTDTMTGGLGDDEYWVDHQRDTTLEETKAGTDLVYATATHSLSANIENLMLIETQAIDGTGNELDNQITGNIANNRLRGEAGNDALMSAAGDDQLDGGVGEDQMTGGIGNDQYWVDSEDDAVVEKANEGTETVYSTIDYTLKANLENLALSGSAIQATGNELNNLIQGNEVNNVIKGMAGDDSLLGDMGDDELDGGTGNDMMTGGVGNDHYHVDTLYDVTVESVDQGIDRVTVTVSHTLNTNIENLDLAGDQAIDGTGNALNNALNGNLANNNLQGEAGDDTLAAHAGDDTLDGGSGKDTLDSGLGNDMLKSYFGDDVMIGGQGDDAYWINTTTDRITELANGGADSVYTSVSYSLGDQIENLTLTESGAVNGTGNTLDNQMVGNDAVNYLSAGGGNDRAEGGAGNDYIYGETGDDVLLGGFDDDIMKGGDGIDWLSGDIGNDWLTGDVGNDTLLGNSGKDRLLGGLGDDMVTGGDGKDSLFGDVGDDVMIGGKGNDWMFGGAGGDRFLFASTRQGVDTIKDFTIRRDKIVLNREQFTTLNRIRFDTVETLQQAKRSQSQLTYIRSSGVLFYNENGRETGFGGSGGQFIKLDPGLGLRAKDLALTTFS